MKTQTGLTPDAPMVQALARGVCPICTLTRAFQNAMVDAPHRYPATRLCNFHAWSLAHASPAVEAIPILRTMLTSAAASFTGPVPVPDCDWCLTLREFEYEKMAEYACRLKEENFRTWVTQYGTVCLFHGQRLVSTLPISEAGLIQRILARNKEELETQLQNFEARLRRGEKGGGGVLGHVAEFLVAQRGITR